MKNIILILALTVFVSGTVLAQMPPSSKPDMELTEEEANLRIQDYQAKVSELEETLKTLNGETDNVKAQIEQAKKDLKDCQDALLKLIGASQADVEAFMQKLGQLEGRVREMKRYSNDELADRRAEVEELDRQYMELRKSKISVLPNIYPRMVTLGKDIKGLYREKKITTYTVGTWSENRDCLWNIAGNTEIYNDPNQWPKIWQANTDQIRNPDIIYPGQVLQIPPKGPKNAEELKAERRYYRMKREAMEEEATTGNEMGNNE